MALTESKLWKDYIKPNILMGFRIESCTMLGIPDCFVILKNGMPAFIELKIKPIHRPGQARFRKDYGLHIPCFLLLAQDKPVKSKLFGSPLTLYNTTLVCSYKGFETTRVYTGKTSDLSISLATSWLPILAERILE